MRQFPESDIIALVGERPAFNLGESTAPDLHLRDILGGDEFAALAGEPLAYGSAQGDPVLRQVIAHNHGVEPDDVIITAGAIHALFLCTFVACENKSVAVAVEPAFPPMLNLLKVADADVRSVRLSFEEGYRLDLARIADHLSLAVSLVCLASPQNPSGVSVAGETIGDISSALANVAPQSMLLVDETFREAVYADEVPAPSVAGLADNIVTCGSLSKCHGAPGLRIGWIITRNEAFRHQAILGKFNTIMACSSVDEALAVKVLKQDGELIRERRWKLADAKELTYRWVAGNAAMIEWVEPDAGGLCCVRLRPDAFDDPAVQRFHDLLSAQNILVAGGDWFGQDRRIFRLGFGYLELDHYELALERLTATLYSSLRTAA